MQKTSFETLTREAIRPASAEATWRELPVKVPALKVAILTGGQDPHYACGLTRALIEQGVHLEVIGNDTVDGLEMHNVTGLKFLHLYGNKLSGGFFARAKAIAVAYLRLIVYAAASQAEILHILWNYKIESFDRTLLMLYFRLLAKKITLTAHNVNAARRDAKDSAVNRFTLRIQYRLCHHIFVHTQKMKQELMEQFGMPDAKVTIIPYGINNAVPNTQLTRAEAKERLGIKQDEKALLFFGAIKPYKGLEYLVAAFQALATRDASYRLIIAGERKKESGGYLCEIQKTIAHQPSASRVIQQIEFIPDQVTELYFKAADVAVLPYTEIFQSGILFLAYSFGVPVISTKVGSFADEIIAGETGFLCDVRDSLSLAAAIANYFESELYRRLPERVEQIQNRAFAAHSWTTVGEITRKAYADLLAN